ncbi:MAG: hypothetical protein PHF79_03555 [Candidatus Pacebacteria bacterium]|nr:hypothetical protein [Candidatus Paceibacterota bacterium]
MSRTSSVFIVEYSPENQVKVIESLERAGLTVPAFTQSTIGENEIKVYLSDRNPEQRRQVEADLKNKQVIIGVVKGVDCISLMERVFDRHHRARGYFPSTQEASRTAVELFTLINPHVATLPAVQKKDAKLHVGCSCAM